ncbi:MAG TPA: DUF2079 domain-containing protein [Myxococcota bacterium]|nr:DUF2079 domain-containing protein [Myxococcota bacterium]
MSIAVLAVLAWLWWCTASSTISARIAAMQTVEPYGLAVFEQLIFNFRFGDGFSQTIHSGYSDAWTWGGHRAPVLVPVAWLYGVAPSAQTLSHIQILAVLAGVIPAALIGRRHLGSDWGLMLAALYLASPPVLELALQDYQDLVFALPGVVLAWWAFGHERWWLAPIGALACILPREETLVLAPVIALVALPLCAAPTLRGRLRPLGRLLRVAIALVMVGAYVVLSTELVPQDEYAMPLQGVSHDFISARGVIKLEGAGSTNFYLSCLGPLPALTLFAPIPLLGSIGTLLVHATIPSGHGIDRHWSSHAHHVAPAVAFAAVASVVGAARILRLLAWSRLGVAARVLPILAAAVGAAWCGHQMKAWAVERNWVTGWTPVEPSWTHPAWALAEQVPPDAVLVVPVEWCLAASGRSRSYTIGESLAHKGDERGLGAASHILIHDEATEVIARVEAMSGAELLAHDSGIQLWTWAPGALDPDPPTGRLDRAQVPRAEQLHPRGTPGIAPNPVPQPVKPYYIRWFEQ